LNQAIIDRVEGAPAPLVSVVMSSYADPFPRLCRAVDSVLNQTVSDIELLVVLEPNDDNAKSLRQAYGDTRLRVLENPRHAGKAGSFNNALDHARGRFIARLDSDDSARPDRFEKQLAFFAENPDVAILGGAVSITDEDGLPIATRQFGRSHRKITRRFSLINAMCHPTIMWDTASTGADLRYDTRYSVEDLELWFRLLSRGKRFANLEEPLIEYKQTAQWRRPMQNWRGNLHVRMRYWYLAFRHPYFLVGLAAFSILAVLPKYLVDKLTQRSMFSDFLRSIRPTANSISDR